MPSEFAILAGMIIAGLLLFMIIEFFIIGEEETVEEYGYKAEAEGLVSLINRVSSEPNEYVLYCQYVSPCDIRVENGVLTYEKDTVKYSFPVPTSVNVTNLKRVATICVLKSGDVINLLEEKPICVIDGFCTPDECKEDCPDCYGPDSSCIGDGYCNKFIDEHCVNSIDCSCDVTKICCPTSPDADENGCSNTTDITKGEECWCSDQCESGLECNPTTSDFTDWDKACCGLGKSWDGSECIEIFCPETITPCYNHWHWQHYGEMFDMNVNGYTCDYYEVCHDPVVRPIAEEIINCCNNKCAGNCHSMCNRALSDSGLSSTDSSFTRKKCYGLYAIYGLGPARRWMLGYQVNTEEPASIMLTQGTWMCTGYSIVLTTLLRSVGYERNEAYSACGGVVYTQYGPVSHAYNIVMFPGESNYRFADTVGNTLYISGITGADWYAQQGGCRSEPTCDGSNDVWGHIINPPTNIIMGGSC